VQRFERSVVADCFVSERAHRVEVLGEVVESSSLPRLVFAKTRKVDRVTIPAARLNSGEANFIARFDPEQPEVSRESS
jgi:hypothetical protein